jgi:hypothetical protein
MFFDGATLRRCCEKKGRDREKVVVFVKLPATPAPGRKAEMPRIMQSSTTDDPDYIPGRRPGAGSRRREKGEHDREGHDREGHDREGHDREGHARNEEGSCKERRTRSKRGHKKGQKRAKLTAPEVLLARMLYHQDGWSMCSIGARLRVHTKTVRDIINERTWKHVKGAWVSGLVARDVSLPARDMETCAAAAEESRLSCESRLCCEVRLPLQLAEVSYPELDSNIASVEDVCLYFDQQGCGQLEV